MKGYKKSNELRALKKRVDKLFERVDHDKAKASQVRLLLDQSDKVTQAQMRTFESEVEDLINLKRDQASAAKNTIRLQKEQALAKADPYAKSTTEELVMRTTRSTTDNDERLEAARQAINRLLEENETISKRAKERERLVRKELKLRKEESDALRVEKGQIQKRFNRLSAQKSRLDSQIVALNGKGEDLQSNVEARKDSLKQMKNILILKESEIDTAKQR